MRKTDNICSVPEPVHALFPAGEGSKAGSLTKQLFCASDIISLCYCNSNQLGRGQERVTIKGS